MHIEINEQFKKALHLLENTDKNLFITGKAGTGKSTLLNYFRLKTAKNIAVLAPTGVSALNIKGQTIHSFFRFQPNITIDTVKKYHFKNSEKNIYKILDAIIIDEISMVRADLLDCIDRFMRLNGKSPQDPFGGIQIIFFGDLYQLPPVMKDNEKELFSTLYKSPYFFDSLAFNDLKVEYIELEKHYRQKDSNFIRLLNSVRNNSISQADLDQLNERLIPEFIPDSKLNYITLTTTNKLADEINELKLSHINSAPEIYSAVTSGNFDNKLEPAYKKLIIKIGSQVMLLNNDNEGRWVNGSLGKIISINKNINETDSIIVELNNGNTVTVLPFTWELFQFSYNSEEKRLVSKTVGTFTQYPLMLSWAVTIHKSQGKTFENVIIDIGKGTFAHGQTYVALSRCTKLTGIILRKKIEKKHIIMDWRVVKFTTKYQYQKSNELLPIEQKLCVIKKAIEENKKLNIIYLKSNDEKSNRYLMPISVGNMSYLGKEFIGVSGFDSLRKTQRTFRVDKILELKIE